MSAPENPPAFPCQPLGQDGLPSNELSPGMTLRDYFAGQALAGLMFRANGPTQRGEIAVAALAKAIGE